MDPNGSNSPRPLVVDLELLLRRASLGAMEKVADVVRVWCVGSVHGQVY